jgi:hypothetical protein
MSDGRKKKEPHDAGEDKGSRRGGAEVADGYGLSLWHDAVPQARDHALWQNAVLPAERW